MRNIFFISDRTAITTESLGSALISQFPNIKFHKEVIPFVDTVPKARQEVFKIKALYEQDGIKPIVVSSILDEMVRKEFNLDCILHVDLFASFLPIFEQELHTKSAVLVGKSHGIDNHDVYYQRIEAIDYALYHDDGASNGYHSADIYSTADVILVGVSRVGKTPTCLYLAVNYGIKAANYPLVEANLQSEQLPNALAKHRGKLFGLIINPRRLADIRAHRRVSDDYASLKRCSFEIMTTETMLQQNHIPYVDSSYKSIEEIAAAIMQKIHIGRNAI